MSCNLRGLLNKSITKQGFSKDTKTANLLGCDFETIQNHLILSAINNYGFLYSPFVKYEIDHIIPCSSATSEEELIKLQHYTNLQYLTEEDNINKSNKMDWNISQSITWKNWRILNG